MKNLFRELKYLKGVKAGVNKLIIVSAFTTKVNVELK